jgi:hypothetical protein
MKYNDGTSQAFEFRSLLATQTARRPVFLERRTGVTYSIKVRAMTRVECKRRFVQALSLQTNGQPGHVHDRAHVERTVCALVDALKESQFEECVVDAYGYVSVAADGSARMVTANLKVYMAPIGGEAIGNAVMPPPGTF